MMLNTQEQEGLDRRSDGLLDVVAVWSTIQGEGPLQGVPAVFVRLAGCNLQCPYCDTDYTSSRRLVSPSDLAVEVVEQSPIASLIVLTGGEPLRQNIVPFVKVAQSFGFHVQLETNGTLGLPRVGRTGCTVVCSPKVPKIHPDLHPDAYKYVLQSGFVSDRDGLPTRVLGLDVDIARPPTDCSRRNVYVQPMDQEDQEQNQRNTQACVESCLQFGYRLCLQTHKLVGLD